MNILDLISLEQDVTGFIHLMMHLLEDGEESAGGSKSIVFRKEAAMTFQQMQLMQYMRPQPFK